MRCKTTSDEISTVEKHLPSIQYTAIEFDSSRIQLKTIDKLIRKQGSKRTPGFRRDILQKKVHGRNESFQNG